MRLEHVLVNLALCKDCCSHPCHIDDNRNQTRVGRLQGITVGSPEAVKEVRTACLNINARLSEGRNSPEGAVDSGGHGRGSEILWNVVSWFYCCRW
jgi:hypothetical protein